MPPKQPVIHPGEILREEFLAELDLSAYAVAKAIDVPRDRIESIIREKRSITADTAVRLGLFFGTTAHFWLHLQNRFDIDVAEKLAFVKNRRIKRYMKSGQVEKSATANRKIARG